MPRQKEAHHPILSSRCTRCLIASTARIANGAIVILAARAVRITELATPRASTTGTVTIRSCESRAAAAGIAASCRAGLMDYKGEHVLDRRLSSVHHPSAAAHRNESIEREVHLHGHDSVKMTNRLDSQPVGVYAELVAAYRGGTINGISATERVTAGRSASGNRGIPGPGIVA